LSGAANIAPSDFVPTAASAILFCVPLSLTGKAKAAIPTIYIKALLLWKWFGFFFFGEVFLVA